MTTTATAVEPEAADHGPCSRPGCTARRPTTDTYCRPHRAAYQRDYRATRRKLALAQAQTATTGSPA